MRKRLIPLLAIVILSPATSHAGFFGGASEGIRGHWRSQEREAAQQRQFEHEERMLELQMRQRNRQLRQPPPQKKAVTDLVKNDLKLRTETYLAESFGSDTFDLMFFERPRYCSISLDGRDIEVYCIDFVANINKNGPLNYKAYSDGENYLWDQYNPISLPVDITAYLLVVQASHPDWLEIYNSDGFLDWLDRQGEAIKSDIKSDDPKRVIATFDKYKEQL